MPKPKLLYPCVVTEDQFQQAIVSAIPAISVAKRNAISVFPTVQAI
jgi:hypothetical protein